MSEIKCSLRNWFINLKVASGGERVTRTVNRNEFQLVVSYIEYMSIRERLSHLSFLHSSSTNQCAEELG
jgi:hypothetical protein